MSTPTAIQRTADAFVYVRGITGALCVIAPGPMGRGWTAEAARLPGGQLAMRSLGSREVALAWGLTRAGTDSDRRRPWLLAASGADVVDVLGTMWSLRRLPRRWGSVATIALGSAACATQLVAARRGTPSTGGEPGRTPSRRADRADLVRSVARTAVQVAGDRLRVGPVADPAVVPARIEDVTPAWLTGTVGRSVPGAVVTDVAFGPGSSGTSVRRQIQLRWNDVGVAAGLPATVFAKATPTLMTRIANGLTGTSTTEAGFYTDLRPQLELEAPIGWHSAVDGRTHRSLHLLEDLTTTRGASFCTPLTKVDRAQADQLIDVLVALHGSAAANRIATDGRPSWMRTYAGWWEAGLRVADIERYHAKGYTQAAAVIPAELRSSGADLWAAFQRSVEAHDTGPRTVIHNDVHLGNWYQTAEGRMGLCDWQCVCLGLGTRDLAYAIATALRVEDRRSWERNLVRRYSTALHRNEAEVWASYVEQLPGALMMWTSTLSKPPGLPEMQPRATSLEMIRRITSALADHR